MPDHESLYMLTTHCIASVSNKSLFFSYLFISSLFCAYLYMTIEMNVYLQRIIKVDPIIYLNFVL